MKKIMENKTKIMPGDVVECMGQFSGVVVASKIDERGHALWVDSVDQMLKRDNFKKAEMVFEEWGVRLLAKCQVYSSQVAEDGEYLAEIMWLFDDPADGDDIFQEIGRYKTKEEADDAAHSRATTLLKNVDSFLLHDRRYFVAK